jgi:hypothetical protein
MFNLSYFLIKAKKKNNNKFIKDFMNIYYIIK